MGVTASLTRYPAETVAESKSMEVFYPLGDGAKARCHLDRSWDELHPAFRSFGPPLDIALSGDYGYEGGLDAFGWGYTYENDHYLAFVTPDMVRKIAAAFAGLTAERIADWFSKSLRGSEYTLSRYHEMVAFYVAAATAGDCVFICVS